MIGFVFEVVSELILFGFVLLFLTVVTVWVVWHIFEKIGPNEVKNIRSFRDLHCCGCSVCDALLRRAYNPGLRSDDDCIG